MLSTIVHSTKNVLNSGNSTSGRKESNDLLQNLENDPTIYKRPEFSSKSDHNKMAHLWEDNEEVDLKGEIQENSTDQNVENTKNN
jgi:hypothetical protein